MGLNELREEIANMNVEYDLDETIMDTINLLSDYDSEHEKTLFDDLIYRFVSADEVFDSARNARDLSELGSILMYVDDFDNDYYLDDGDYGYSTFSASDVENWIIDILAVINREIGGDTDANK